MTCAVDMILGEEKNGYKWEEGDHITTILTSKWIAIPMVFSAVRRCFLRHELNS
jgi:hypothetical protein